MYQIDTSSTELAEEFRAAPLGPYSLELRRLLALLMGGPMAGRPILVATEDGKFAIGTIPERRGEPIPVEDEPYDDLKLATWELFRRRWEWTTGEPLEL